MIEFNVNEILRSLQGRGRFVNINPLSLIVQKDVVIDIAPNTAQTTNDAKSANIANSASVELIDVEDEDNAKNETAQILLSLSNQSVSTSAKTAQTTNDAKSANIANSAPVELIDLEAEDNAKNETAQTLPSLSNQSVSTSDEVHQKTAAEPDTQAKRLRIDYSPAANGSASCTFLSSEDNEEYTPELIEMDETDQIDESMISWLEKTEKTDDRFDLVRCMYAQLSTSHTMQVKTAMHLLKETWEARKYLSEDDLTQEEQEEKRKRLNNKVQDLSNFLKAFALMYPDDWEKLNNQDLSLEPEKVANWKSERKKNKEDPERVYRMVTSMSKHCKGKNQSIARRAVEQLRIVKNGSKKYLERFHQRAKLNKILMDFKKDNPDLYTCITVTAETKKIKDRVKKKLKKS